MSMIPCICYTQERTGKTVIKWQHDAHHLLVCYCLVNGTHLNKTTLTEKESSYLSVLLFVILMLDEIIDELSTTHNS